MRMLLSSAGAIVAIAFLVASAGMNFHFGQSLGRTPFEAMIYGGVSVLAVLCNGLCPFFLAWGWERRRFAATAAAALLWCLCLIFSLTSALGFAAENRGSLVGERAALQQSYEAAQSRLADLEQTRHRYRYAPKHLEDRIDTVRKEIVALQARGATEETDPQSKMIARATLGLLKENQVQLALVALFAIMVEVGAALGLFVALAHLPPRAPSQHASITPKAPTTKAPPRWMPPAQRKNVVKAV